MAINKVVYAGTILIDLTSDTVTSSDDVLAGLLCHLADGTQVTGTLADGDNLGYGSASAIVGSAIVGQAVI